MKSSTKKSFLLKIILLSFVGVIFISCSILEKRSLLEKDDRVDFKLSSDTLISIEHTEYLGQCYTLVISADGNVILTPTKYMGYGDPDVPQKVPIKSRITNKQLVQIIREFEKEDFFSLKDTYRMQQTPECSDIFTDGSSKTVSITINGRKKSVFWENCFTSSQFLPARLGNITNKIHEVVNIKQTWYSPNDI